MATITRARSARGSDASQARSARGSDASQPRRRPSPQPLASGAIESDDGTATGSPKRTRSFARSPPSASQADDDEQQSSFGGFHYIPLIFALVPPLGAIIHGRAEAWTDSLMLLVISFYLYQIVRMPWEMYFAARTRRVLEAAPEDDEADEDTRVDRHRRRRDAMTELRQHELFALALCVAAPGIGAWLLYSVRGVLSEPERYINPFSIRLFVLASGIKPWLHLVSLLRSRSLFLQETVHYPHGHVQRLRERTEKVEQDMASLRRMFATKADVRLLRDGIDAPLTQLSKAVRRHERKEEYLRLTAEERFQLVDSRLEEAMRELAIQADLLDAVRDEAERARRSALNPLATLFGFLHSRRNFDARARWYERGLLWYMFMPINLGNLALTYAGDLGDRATGRIDDGGRHRLVEDKKVPAERPESPSTRMARNGSAQARYDERPESPSARSSGTETMSPTSKPISLVARSAPAVRISPATPPNHRDYRFSP